MTASATPLTVAVLGAGNIGRPLARHWLAAGHTVAIGSRTPGEPTDLTTPAGAPVSTVSPASKCRSSRSISTTSRMQSVVSTARPARS